MSKQHFQNLAIIARNFGRIPTLKYAWRVYTGKEPFGEVLTDEMLTTRWKLTDEGWVFVNPYVYPKGAESLAVDKRNAHYIIPNGQTLVTIEQTRKSA